MNNPKQNLIDDTISDFQATFKEKPRVIVTAPGRVNLIGEHTDYNEGFVLPVAINRAVAIAASVRTDNKLLIYSKTYRSLAEVTVDNLQPTNVNSWSNYVKAVGFFLQQRGEKLKGANLYINSDVPQQVGLSSSAALEMTSAHVFLFLNNVQLSPLEIIKLCQRAENEYVGVQCGIMDQFISCLGRKENALFLDCRTLGYQHVRIPTGCALVVCDTGVKRELMSSEYNIRREQCNQGVKDLSSVLLSIRALRDVSPQQFHENEHLLGEIVRKRCHHVITENERVKDSVEALKRGDLSEFGKLMYQSHLSLKNNYEVSCTELDAVVDICAEQEGVYGARMTGAGFGGCAICLVKEEFTEALVARLQTEYPQKTGRQPTVYTCTIEDGVKVSKL